MECWLFSKTCEYKSGFPLMHFVHRWRSLKFTRPEIKTIAKKDVENVSWWVRTHKLHQPVICNPTPYPLSYGRCRGRRGEILCAGCPVHRSPHRKSQKCFDPPWSTKWKEQHADHSSTFGLSSILLIEMALSHTIQSLKLKCSPVILFNH